MHGILEMRDGRKYPRIALCSHSCVLLLLFVWKTTHFHIMISDKWASRELPPGRGMKMRASMWDGTTFLSPSLSPHDWCCESRAQSEQE